MGLPILMASPTGEARSILEADQAGLHVPAENPAALAEAVQHLKGDPVLLKELAANSLRAAPRHSREVQARDMANVLQDVSTRK